MCNSDKNYFHIFMDFGFISPGHKEIKLLVRKQPGDWQEL